MGHAAVPGYLNRDFKDAPPGHRFGLYFEGWKPSFDGIPDGEKKAALDRLSGIGQETRATLKALRDRQSALAQADADEMLSLPGLPAKSTAPFTTGLGNEHPLENGFAFLNPYGVPYLPGSGVKGVLRRAAEQLALFEVDRKGWDIVAVWWLFGFEPTATCLTGPSSRTPEPLREEAQRWRDSYPGEVDAERLRAFITLSGEKTDWLDDQQGFLQALRTDTRLRDRVRNRGALICWDVFPQLDRLRVDILNPHHTEYYQKGKSPHDAESPIPVFFLTVPPGSGFEFHIRCQTNRLPEGLRAEWRELVTAALEFAFDWLGFGAKTAVGYGQMEKDDEAIQQRDLERQRHMADEEAARQEAQRLAARAAMSPLERRIAELSEQAETPRHRARLLSNALVNREFGDESVQAADRIRAIMQQDKTWKETSQKKKPEKDDEYQATLKVLKALN